MSSCLQSLCIDRFAVIAQRLNHETERTLPIHLPAQKLNWYRNLTKDHRIWQLLLMTFKLQHIKILVSFLFLSGSERCGGKEIRVLFLPLSPLLTGVRRVLRRWKWMEVPSFATSRLPNQPWADKFVGREKEGLWIILSNNLVFLILRHLQKLFFLFPLRSSLACHLQHRGTVVLFPGSPRP